MKKISLLFTFLFFTTFTFAQFTVTDYDNVPILDGDIRGFNSVIPSEATLYFWINNESADEDIYIKIKLESILNSDGSSFQFCFATLCIESVEEGQTYPASPPPNDFITIPAGGTNPQFDKFQNENEGDGTNYPIDYVWKFFQVDGNGDEIGESITFTYRYDPNLSVSDFENSMGVSLQNTLATDMLTVSSINPLNYKIFNINGQLMNSSHIGSGINNINVSGLNYGVYFIKFANEMGNTTTMKFVVK
jgi:hypothetical protein